MESMPQHMTPRLERTVSQGVALIGDPHAAPRIRFGFTERSGGVSTGPFASLDLGDRCGDDPAAVAENRRRALRALGAEGLEDRLINPHQVHGDHLVVIDEEGPDALAAARREAAEGADGVICTVPDVPVLLCFADCVPVVLVAPHAFAIAHSGWRGTKARIAAKAARALSEASSTPVSDLKAYIGPHIGGADYEVSEELLESFVEEFGEGARYSPRHLDLEAAIRIALAEAGVPAGQVASVEDSTAQATDRFFSYRASGGACGRHGALALMRR